MFICSFFQPKYELRKGNGQTTYMFTKIVTKQSKKLNDSIRTIGDEMMGPIICNWEKGQRQRRSKMGQLAKKVARKASYLGPIMRPSPSRTLDSNIFIRNAIKMQSKCN